MILSNETSPCYFSQLFISFLVLSWEKVNLPQDGKINRRVMVEAALTNNATLVAALYDFDYRIDVDFLEGETRITNLLKLASKS